MRISQVYVKNGVGGSLLDDRTRRYRPGPRQHSRAGYTKPPLQSRVAKRRAARKAATTQRRVK